MNIRKELLREHSKQQAERIAAFVGSDEMKFQELIGILTGDDYRSSQRAAWVVSKCIDAHPHLLEVHVRFIILNLKNEVPIAVKRNSLRILQEVELPEDILGEAADVCFRIMESNSEPIAVKVFAMTVLANICEQLPELSNELIVLIEDQLPYGSAGFRSRGNKELIRLRKLSDQFI